jgi:hypothetical protein
MGDAWDLLFLAGAACSDVRVSGAQQKKLASRGLHCHIRLYQTTFVVADGKPMLRLLEENDKGLCRESKWLIA